MPSPRSRGGTEVPVLFRKFAGTNTTVHPTFLPPDVLQRSRNWVPDQAFILKKRPGVAAFQNMGASDAVTVMIRLKSGSSRYLYAVRDLTAAGGDGVVVSVDDAAFAGVTGGSFTSTTGRTYGAVRYGNFAYFGNGVDPIKRVAIGGNGIDLAALDPFTDGSAAPTVAADPGSRILSGTYAYSWCVFDHGADTKWDLRATHATAGSAREITVDTSGDSSLLFPIATGHSLTGSQRFHLFVAPLNLPIEFAHDQTTEGKTTGTTVLRNISVDGPPIPIAQGVERLGKFLVAHRGRIWAAGDETSIDSRRRVYATSILIPGMEQELWNSSDFFPANAVIQIPVGDITGLGVVSLTDTQRSPSSPLAIFTETDTWILLGDILDDPTADLVQLSARIGCASHRTIASVLEGLIFLGTDSVYLLSPDGNIRNIGWPIQREIRAIPPGQRVNALGAFHDGFYKLFVTPSGASTNTDQWWLDLRRGIGQLPSWWGPHRTAVTNAIPQSIAVGTDEASVVDRLFGATSGGVVSEHNSGTTDLGTDVASSLLTGIVDGGNPFQRKLATQARATADVSSQVTLTASVELNGGDLRPLGSMVFAGTTGGVWGTGLWDDMSWGSEGLMEEGKVIAEADRPRGRLLALQLDHQGSETIQLADVELTYLPVDRPGD